MFCAQCGNRLADDSRFCTYCGSPVKQAPASDPYRSRSACSNGENPRADKPRACGTRGSVGTSPTPAEIGNPATYATAPAVGGPATYAGMQDQAVLFVNSAPQVPLRSLTKYTLPNGSHSVMVVPVSMSFDDVAAAVRMHMAQNGYKLTERYGEMVWKKGTGVATAMHFIKVEYAPGYAIMHGWVQSGIGKAGMNDMSLDGFMGAIPKSTCKQVILDLAGKLR